MNITAIAAGISLAAGLGLGAWLSNNSHAADVQTYATRIADMQSEQNRLRVAALQANAAALQANTDRAYAASTAAAQKNGGINVEYRTITKTVERIVDRPVYLNQCIDDDGLRIINGFISGARDSINSASDPG